MTLVEVIKETEQPGGWMFDAQWIDDAGNLRNTSITLSWADYNLWSVSGSDEPARVAMAVISFWLQQPDAPPPPERFDAAILRRRFVNADAHIPRLI